MAIETLQKVSIHVVLDNGTDSYGNVKSITSPLFDMNEDFLDNAKAYSVVSALAPCLRKTVVQIKKVEVSTLTMA